MRIVVATFFLLCATAYANPWGKDADLANRQCVSTQCCQRGPLISFAKVAIMFHKNVISPADGPRSSYYPSSSMYTLQAIEKYGFFKGVMMGCDRLQRENDDPWIYPMCRAPDGQLLKSDPIP